MDNHHRDILRRTRVKLLNSIYKVEEICDALQTSDILTQSMVAEIMVRLKISNLMLLSVKCMFYLPLGPFILVICIDQYMSLFI